MSPLSLRSAGPRARLALFTLLALLFSWSYWLAILAGQRGWLPIHLPLGPAGSFGPALAALATAAACGGRADLGALFRSLLRWRARWPLYVAALVGMTGVLAVTMLVQVARGAPLPAPTHLDRWYLLPGVALLILVLGGPLGEEIGWRGYALPHLLELASPFAASLVLAGIWLVWHLPLFWMPGSSQADVPLPTFAWTILCYTPVFTWMHLRSRASTLLAVLLHTGINTAWFLLPTVLPGAMEQAGFTASFLATSTVVAASIIATNRREFFRRDSAAAR